MELLIRRLQALEDDLAAEPLLGGDEVPTEDAEDGDGAEDDAGEVERLGGRREEERRDLGLFALISAPRSKIGGKRNTHGEHKRVEERSADVERLPPLPEVEVRALEVVRRHREPEEGNQAVRGGGGDTAGGDEGVESDLTWEDGAQDRRTEEEHDGDGVAWLPLSID